MLKMNKKGFTLVEILLVIVIMAIITLMVMPNIVDMLKTSKDKKYITIENVLKNNLELYNLDYMEDLWCVSSETTTCPETENKIVSFNELLKVNSDINVDNCEVKELNIQKNSNKFTYNVEVCCIENNEVAYKTNEDTICP